MCRKFEPGSKLCACCKPLAPHQVLRVTILRQHNPYRQRSVHVAFMYLRACIILCRHRAGVSRAGSRVYLCISTNFPRVSPRPVRSWQCRCFFGRGVMTLLKGCPAGASQGRVLDLLWGRWAFWVHRPVECRLLPEEGVTRGFLRSG